MLAAALLGAAALASAGRDAEQSACPAFSHAASPYACTCEIAQNSGCRGVTPRFNWIIGLCDEPEPDEPKPDRAHGKLTPAGGYQCGFCTAGFVVTASNSAETLRSMPALEANTAA